MVEVVHTNFSPIFSDVENFVGQVLHIYAVVDLTQPL